MASLNVVRARPSPPWVDAPSASGKFSEEWPGRAKGPAAGVAAEPTYLAVVVTSAAESGEPASEEWRAELKLAECSRVLPLAWPLSEWLDDYRGLLVTALSRPRHPHYGARRAARWTEEIREFLQLMLAGRDKSAAELIRSLTQLYPFAEETRRLRRVQALFAAIRPARSLAEALDFRIVTQPVAS
jgi:hypothetical protein